MLWDWGCDPGHITLLSVSVVAVALKFPAGPRVPPVLHIFVQPFQSGCVRAREKNFNVQKKVVL